MASIQVFKVTGPNGEAHIARNGFKYPLPSGKRPGKWMHADGPLESCANGMHACRSVLDIGQHMNTEGFTVWFAEAKGDTLEGRQKTAFRSLRLVKKSLWSKECAVLFAADCAERSLINSGWDHADSWNAVSVARQVATNKIAADSAAYSAARSAAYSAARSARSADSAAYSAARSAAYSARSAADSAAYSAADSAADSVIARKAEIAWQEKRLLQYLEHGEKAMKMKCDGWISTKGIAP